MNLLIRTVLKVPLFLNPIKNTIETQFISNKQVFKKLYLNRNLAEGRNGEKYKTGKWIILVPQTKKTKYIATELIFPLSLLLLL